MKTEKQKTNSFFELKEGQSIIQFGQSKVKYPVTREEAAEIIAGMNSIDRELFIEVALVVGLDKQGLDSFFLTQGAYQVIEKPDSEDDSRTTQTN